MFKNVKRKGVRHFLLGTSVCTSKQISTSICGIQQWFRATHSWVKKSTYVMFRLFVVLAKPEYTDFSMEMSYCGKQKRYFKKPNNQTKYTYFISVYRCNWCVQLKVLRPRPPV